MKETNHIKKIKKVKKTTFSQIVGKHGKGETGRYIVKVSKHFDIDLSRTKSHA